MEPTHKLITLSEFEDQYIGKQGTPERDAYDVELQGELLSEALKELRKKLMLTQSEVGERIGVKKAQISRLEHSEGQMSLVTALKIFKALKAKVTMVIEYNDGLDKEGDKEPTFYKELELVH